MTSRSRRSCSSWQYRPAALQKGDRKRIGEGVADGHRKVTPSRFATRCTRRNCNGQPLVRLNTRLRSCVLSICLISSNKSWSAALDYRHFFHPCRRAYLFSLPVLPTCTAYLQRHDAGTCRGDEHLRNLLQQHTGSRQRRSPHCNSCSRSTQVHVAVHVAAAHRFT